jgi:hypothetical protein
MEKEKLLKSLNEKTSREAKINALKKISNIKDLSNLDYDYQGAVNAGMTPDERGHWDNKFKRPNHITFGSDSIYSNPINQGGEWSKLNKPQPTGEEWQFTPSLYQQLRIPKEEYQKYFSEQEAGKGGAILDYPIENNNSAMNIIKNILNKNGK